MPTSWEPLGRIVVGGCWGLFILVWLVAAVLTAREAPPVLRRGSARSSVPLGVVLILLVLLIRRFVPAGSWRLLAYRAPWLGVLGVIVLVGGMAFAFWARLRLGAMWTSMPVVRLGHQLRTDGPYRITRHPIYTGILGMIAGTAMIGGLGVWLFVLVVGAAAIVVKARAEERLLASEFGREYAEFRRRVPGLLPRPWRR